MTEQRFVVIVDGRRLDPMKVALAVATLTNPRTDRVLVEGEPGDRAYVIPRALVGPPVDDTATDAEIDRFMAAVEGM